MSSDVNQARSIDRREAIRRVTALLGGIALVSESALLTGCRDRGANRGAEPARFSDSDIAFLDEVAETILPETSTPGAKAAKVGAFMALMVTDSYEPADQQIFRDGMQQLNAAARTKHNAAFMAATPEQRLSLLEELDGQQKSYMDAKAEDAPAHYFRMMKELALLGYFTSEIGCTKAMRYVESPGRFDPCAPYTPGETSWAAHA
jgi:Gluconate 2-dehydrogenase subunit 3